MRCWPGKFQQRVVKIICDTDLKNMLDFHMVKSEDVERKVKSIVASQLGIKESAILNNHSFMLDLGADSLDTVELLMALEQSLGLEISDADAEKMTTIQSVIDFGLEGSRVNQFVGASDSVQG